MKDKEKNESLLINGLSKERKDFLYQYSKKELGVRSRTKAILHLIDKAMGGTNPQQKIEAPKVTGASKRERVQISLLEEDYLELQKVAKETDTSMQYYIISLILKDLYGAYRLTGEQIELLRKSNYQLHKIGVNLNQIAKAINEGERRAVPIKMLSEEIAKHIDMVKEVLDNSYNKH